MKIERMERFGEKLRLLRTRNGMTLKSLAENLGYKTHGYISELEAGKKVPTASFLLSVAEIFGVSVDALIKDNVEVNLPKAMESENSPSLLIPFAERYPTEREVERLRLILSTYQDGTGMLASGEKTTLPGWRDFERSVSLAFGGVPSENKDIFDVRLPKPRGDREFFGISCKMRRELDTLARSDRVTIELSNSAGKFWEFLSTKNIDQANYRSHPSDVGKALIELVSKWHEEASTQAGGNVDLSKSHYLVLSWNKVGWYQMHQFCLNLPAPSDLSWEFPMRKNKEGESLPGRRLRGKDSQGTIFEWYGESGGQLKYYPIEKNAVWKSSRFRLEPIPTDQEHSVIRRAKVYFPEKWQDLESSSQ